MGPARLPVKRHSKHKSATSTAFAAAWKMPAACKSTCALAGQYGQLKSNLQSHCLVQTLQHFAFADLQLLSSNAALVV